MVILVESRARRRLTSRKAPKTRSASGPRGLRSLGCSCSPLLAIGPVPLNWEMSVFPVLTISENPAMICGNGPWPMAIRGALRMVML